MTRNDKVADFKVVQRKQVVGDLEKATCEKSMQNVSEQLDIERFISDRHRGIDLLIRTSYPNIVHEYDVCHFGKSLSKKLSSIDKY
jgi:hypothetical protein